MVTFVATVLVLFHVGFMVADDCKDEFSFCKQYAKLCTGVTKISDYVNDVCPKTCGWCDGGGTEVEKPEPTNGPLPPHVGGCGQPDIKPKITRVIGGKTATRGSWPWQVLMKMDGQAMCGGAIVAPQWVVTAAHCVYGNEQYGQFSVVVGEQDRELSEGSEREYDVDFVVTHDKYNPNTLNNDIAMFKLKQPIQFNKYVSSVCLPKKDVPAGSKCFITGWGKMKHPGRMVRHLQQADLPVVTNQQCQKKNEQFIPIPVTDAMICAGSGGKSRKSGCHGDSGGPFVCEVDGRWELHGSVSHGSSKCKSTETYTVFSRTVYFMDWIKQNMENFK